LVRFIVRPQVGPDSNRIWRKNPGAGHEISASSRLIAAWVFGEPQWQISMDAVPRPSGMQDRHMQHTPNTPDFTRRNIHLSNS
ncbi:hypothetical protein, partial [Paracoccus pantotrophus]|uniref:hypothetical protein n=1 Tax=Paracoccus pantotrophus TaxID=82367 RepID=UPI0023E3FA72